ncbi:MAG: hypothetical protein KatS3mg076_2271 [Candidatus Binatia bacterium]|nr:MAG: hypothetical protein KatS3mg076_2271 [Candidatus Binatia bacterium]
MKVRRYLYLAAFALAVMSMLAPLTHGEPVPGDAEALVRDAIDRPPEHGGVDTVLVFTNLLHRPSKAAMTAVSRDGTVVGEAELEIPGNGIAAVTLSSFVDASPSEPFVGQVRAKAAGDVAGTAILLGAPPFVTDLPVLRRVHRVRPASSELDDTQARNSHPVTRITEIVFPATGAN